jgi:enamine deaminase RidA (YjgF/YER057c/UK114 family)
MSAATPEERIAALGLALPKAAGAVANYEPFVVTGSLVMTSGQLPWIDGVLLYKGKIGRELTPEQGYEACRLSALNGLAQLKAALGELSRVRRIVRIEGTLGVVDDFEGHPACLNGASDLINGVFGERGRHTRMIYANPAMPLGCACLVTLIAEF